MKVTDLDSNSGSCNKYNKGANITGQVFGSLTAIERVGKGKQGHSIWSCSCSCGAIKNAEIRVLRNGNVSSCGCQHYKSGKENRTFVHGMVGTKEYDTWCHIKSRCYNKSNQDYLNYGAIGILFDEFTNDFLSFYKEVGSAPSNDHSIDRIDNNKGYISGNMRWATSTQQSRNRSIMKSNTSGVTGVLFKHKAGTTESTHVVATWIDYKGKKNTKNFNCRKLGLLEAFAEAVKHRSNMIAENNLKGAGYSYSHGKVKEITSEIQ